MLCNEKKTDQLCLSLVPVFDFHHFYESERHHKLKCLLEMIHKGLFCREFESVPWFGSRGWMCLSWLPTWLKAIQKKSSVPYSRKSFHQKTFLPRPRLCVRESSFWPFILDFISRQKFHWHFLNPSSGACPGCGSTSTQDVISLCNVESNSQNWPKNNNPANLGGNCGVSRPPDEERELNVNCYLSLQITQAIARKSAEF